MPGYSSSKDQQLARLRRIEGQVRGLQRLIEEDRYCIDVLTQVASVTKALQSLGVTLLEEHMRHCVVDAAAQGPVEGAEKVDEVMVAITRLLRT